MEIRAYILGGGKSSRMGRDKAMVEVGGMTLLARSVGMLRSVSILQAATGEVIVTIAGKRELLEGADRSIVDRYAECGPLGGIEAALNDLECGNEADWAFFIPVDMPLLRSDLIDELLAAWSDAIESDPSLRACLAEVDGRPQPLVSLVHRTVLKEVRMALDAGSYKVFPVLKSAGVCCTSLSQEDPGPGEGSNEAGTLLSSTTPEPRLTYVGEPDGVSQSDDGRSETDLQFANVNTEADLIEVATLMKRRG